MTLLKKNIESKTKSKGKLESTLRQTKMEHNTPRLMGWNKSSTTGDVHSDKCIH